jgi:hypothetical protein
MRPRNETYLLNPISLGQAYRDLNASPTIQEDQVVVELGLKKAIGNWIDAQTGKGQIATF